MSGNATDAVASTAREIARDTTPDPSVLSGEELVLPADSDVRPTLSVVLPTLDEEEGIRECIERIRAAVEELGVFAEIVVSDSSTDRTPEIARAMGAVVVEPDRAGYGYAYQYAFARCRGDYLAMGDADTTYDFAELPKLYDLVADDGADLAMGSRLGGEIRPGAMPALHRYVGNPLLTRFLNVFYDAGVTDAHSGMRVFTREALAAMDLETTGMEFASEMIMEAGARGLEIAEEPITYHARTGEAKLDSFQDGWRHVRFMLLNAPGYLFSVPGVALVGLGVLAMALAATNVSLGVASFGVRTLIAGSLMVISGIQIASFGVYATVASDPIRRPRDRITRFMTESLTLETGVFSGLVVFTLGAGYATGLLLTWITSGYGALPSLAADMLAFTAIVVGMQAIFGSFFMSAIADRRV